MPAGTRRQGEDGPGWIMLVDRSSRTGSAECLPPAVVCYGLSEYHDRRRHPHMRDSQGKTKPLHWFPLKAARDEFVNVRL